MKKKTVALLLSVAMMATAVIGGTMAYFTDTDSAKNVMTTGNVDIRQTERQRTIGNWVVTGQNTMPGGSATLDIEDFEDGKKLIPVTAGEADAKEYDIPASVSAQYMFSNEKNYVDKIVNVVNDGTEDAYVRTLFAFEMVKDENGKWIDPIDSNTGIWLYWIKGLNDKGFIFPENTNDGFDSSDDGYNIYADDVDYTYVTIDGVTYSVAEYYYKTNGDSSLSAGEVTHPSLMQVAMQSHVDNDLAKLLVGPDGEYSILCLTQATQKDGFDDAKTALDTAFGDVSKVSKETLEAWFSACK